MPSAPRNFTPHLDREVVEELAVEWKLKAANRLKRRRLGLATKPTQADIAHQVGVTPAYIGAIERGISLPTEPLRWLLADALFCEVEDIWEPVDRDELRRRCANLVSAA